MLYIYFHRYKIIIRASRDAQATRKMEELNTRSSKYNTDKLGALVRGAAVIAELGFVHHPQPANLMASYCKHLTWS